MQASHLPDNPRNKGSLERVLERALSGDMIGENERRRWLWRALAWAVVPCAGVLGGLGMALVTFLSTILLVGLIWLIDRVPGMHATASQVRLFVALLPAPAFVVGFIMFAMNHAPSRPRATAAAASLGMIGTVTTLTIAPDGSPTFGLWELLVMCSAAALLAGYALINEETRFPSR